jgi:hypothetical protein
MVADAVLEKEYVLEAHIKPHANFWPEKTSRSIKYLAKPSRGVKQLMPWQIYIMA